MCDVLDLVIVMKSVWLQINVVSFSQFLSKLSKLFPMFGMKCIPMFHISSCCWKSVINSCSYLQLGRTAASHNTNKVNARVAPNLLLP